MRNITSFPTVNCETLRDKYRCKPWVRRWTADQNLFQGGNLLSRSQSLKYTYSTAQLLERPGCIKNWHTVSSALFKNVILCFYLFPMILILLHQRWLWFWLYILGKLWQTFSPSLKIYVSWCYIFSIHWVPMES